MSNKKKPQYTLGYYIRSSRAGISWTQEELAEKCDLSRQTVMDIENEAIVPRFDTALILLNVLRAEGAHPINLYSLCL